MTHKTIQRESKTVLFADKITTLKVTFATRDRLRLIGRKQETYDEIINRLCNNLEEK